MTTVVIGLGAWLLPRPNPSTSTAGASFGTRGDGTAAAAIPQTETGSVAPTAGANVVYLDSLTPTAGGSNLSDLPREIPDQAGYQHAIVVRCATGQAGDQSRTVTYPMRARYLSFDATIRPYRSPLEESDTLVEVFRDTVSVGRQAVAVGSTGQLTANVERGDSLVLRVTCESPAAMVILTEARLRHR